jgi:uncharacterized membrane protein
MKTLKSILIFWVIIIFLITFTCLLTYIVAQQLTRLGANDLPVKGIQDGNF